MGAWGYRGLLVPFWARLGWEQSGRRTAWTSTALALDFLSRVLQAVKYKGIIGNMVGNLWAPAGPYWSLTVWFMGRSELSALGPERAAPEGAGLLGGMRFLGRMSAGMDAAMPLLQQGNDISLARGAAGAACLMSGFEVRSQAAFLWQYVQHELRLGYLVNCWGIRDCFNPKLIISFSLPIFSLPARWAMDGNPQSSLQKKVSGGTCPGWDGEG